MPRDGSVDGGGAGGDAGAISSDASSSSERAAIAASSAAAAAPVGSRTMLASATVYTSILAAAAFRRSALSRSGMAMRSSALSIGRDGASAEGGGRFLFGAADGGFRTVKSVEKFTVGATARGIISDGCAGGGSRSGANARTESSSSLISPSVGEARALTSLVASLSLPSYNQSKLSALTHTPPISAAPAPAAPSKSTGSTRRPDEAARTASPWPSPPRSRRASSSSHSSTRARAACSP